ncbi:MAG: hypothetical protein Kow0069_06450 [Promethearchaeota archaeon]
MAAAIASVATDETYGFKFRTSGWVDLELLFQRYQPAGSVVSFGDFEDSAEESGSNPEYAFTPEWTGYYLVVVVWRGGDGSLTFSYEADHSNLMGAPIDLINLLLTFLPLAPCFMACAVGAVYRHLRNRAIKSPTVRPARVQTKPTPTIRFTTSAPTTDPTVAKSSRTSTGAPAVEPRAASSPPGRKSANVAPKLCPFCLNEVPAGARTCPHCGTDI